MTSGDSAPEPVASPQPTVASVVPLVPAWRVGKEFSYAVPDELTGKIACGVLVRVPFGGRKVRGIVTGVEIRPPGRDLEPILSVVIEYPLAPAPMADLLRWVSRRYVASLGRSFEKVVPPRVRVKPRPPSENGPGPPARWMPAYEGGTRLIEAISSGGKGTFVLQTAPGENRVELVAEMIAAVGDRGSTLVTVPEVRYGSVLLDGLKERWPGAARVDAGRDAAARSRGWVEAAAGAPLILGGRSSVFAPSPHLRLIVIDEEHHPTYKEDRSPRYDARRVARERARLQGAVCVLMSPTPTVESSFDALEGRVSHVVPSRDALRAARPLVELIEPEEGRSISHGLHERVRDALRRSERVGLLAPSRGFARAVWCAACRRSLRCERCEAGLAYDRSPGLGPFDPNIASPVRAQGSSGLRCPRCTWTGPAPDRCPNCGSEDFRYLGAGSERLAEQISAAFPKARVVRVDPDVLARSGPPAGEADIYLTTWIGAKEVLRPEVSLVGVLSIDSLIRRPDFRAAERAYRVLAEMSEWAGRGGRLVVQTGEPSHHAVQAVVRGDHGFFVTREIEQRRDLKYPPFSELVKVTVSGSRTEEVIEEIATIAAGTGAVVLGPIPVPLSDFGDDTREVLIKSRDAMTVADALRPTAESIPASTRLRIDVDPR